LIVYLKYAQSQTRRCPWRIHELVRYKKNVSPNIFVIFFSTTVAFITAYNHKFFASATCHHHHTLGQFVTVFRVLRLSQFFLLRARLNCSNKQFYVKRKTRVPSGQPGMCHRASKQVIPSFFGGRQKVDWILFPYHVSFPLPPFCVHFTAFAVARPCLCRGLSQGPSSPSRFCKNIARLRAPRRNRWLI